MAGLWLAMEVLLSSIQSKIGFPIWSPKHKLNPCISISGATQSSFYVCKTHNTKTLKNPFSASPPPLGMINKFIFFTFKLHCHSFTVSDCKIRNIGSCTISLSKCHIVKPCTTFHSVKLIR